MKSTRFHGILRAVLPALLAVAAFAAGGGRASAQGTAFTYQGQLQNNGGPASGTYDLTFTLYSTNLTGTPVATPVTNAALSVVNGLFLATLDFGGTAFSGGARWLEIAVRTNGAGTFTTLTPRQAVGSAPYSIYAANAAVAAKATSYTGSLPATQITGTIPAARLPASVLTNGSGSVNLSGAFAGSGAGLTNVNVGAAMGGSFRLAGSFILTSAPAVGANPQGVTAADINGDGYPDLITANYGDDSLTVLTNNGTGGFVLSSTVPVGKGPYAVVVADVTGNGYPDLVSANSDTNTISVLINDGTGNFPYAATFNPSSSESRLKIGICSEIRGSEVVFLHYILHDFRCGRQV